MHTVPSTSAAALAPARACAYTVLRRVFEQGAYADRALQAEAAGLEPRDRALAMRLAYGAVQRKGTLDHLIERLTERPAAALDAPVLAALRLGLYELLYLSGAPDYAVVAEAVELAKTGAHPRVPGTVWSTRSCDARHAKERTRCSARSARRPPSRRLSSTPIRSG